MTLIGTADFPTVNIKDFGDDYNSWCSGQGATCERVSPLEGWFAYPEGVYEGVFEEGDGVDVFYS